MPSATWLLQEWNAVRILLNPDTPTSVRARVEQGRRMRYAAAQLPSPPPINPHSPALPEWFTAHDFTSSQPPERLTEAARAEGGAARSLALLGGGGGGGGGVSGGRSGPGGGGGVSGGRSGSGYRLGFQPAFRVYADDKLLVTQRIEHNVVDQHVAIQRVEIFQGIDSVNTLTITFIGDDAAAFVRDNFKKRTPVRVEAGYLDIANSWTELFSGHALQAYPNGALPIRIDLECDSLIYQAREMRGSGDNTDPSQAEYIKNRLAAVSEDYPLTVNIDGIGDPEADIGGADTGSLLEFMNSWCQENFVHWVDLMNGEIHLFYPGAKPDFIRPWRTWELSIRRVRTGDSGPPILTNWTPRMSFVESPETVEAVWYDRTNEDSIKEVVVTATNENGVPDSKLQLGFLDVKDQAAAQAVVDAAADDYYWASIMGGFSVAAGVPIILFDEIIARNGPPGLEGLYDRPMEVYEVTHTISEAGWVVEGKVRGGRSRAGTGAA